MRRPRWQAIVVAGACALLGLSGLQPGAPAWTARRVGETGPGLHAPLDAILDLFVRDGLVYYQALKRERGRLDRYLAALDVAPAVYAAWSRKEQLAFWINAYNAFVLRIVIDHYPIRGRPGPYPANSIRQVPGAFDRIRHRAAGRLVTLDEIEYRILPTFDEPRAYFALGRGAVGSPRLRSEAYLAERLQIQLADATREVATTPRHVHVDPVADQIEVTPVIGWHEAEFARKYGGDAGGRYAGRSAIERAILTLIEPHLLPRERAVLQANTFRVRYQEFDWRLNDLTGGGASFAAFVHEVGAHGSRLDR